MNTYTVHYTSDDSDEPEQIGKVSADAKGMLTVVEADPNHKDFFEEIVDLVNKKESLSEPAPSPKDSPKFTNTSRIVERTDPGFIKVLSDYLEKYYGVTLEPV